MFNLMRFYGIRRELVLLLGGLVWWCALMIFSDPPAYFAEWPVAARSSLSNLISGTLAISQAAWIYLIFKPLLWSTGKMAWGARAIVGLFLVPGGLGLIQLIVGTKDLVNVGARGFMPVTVNWFRVAGIPLLVGLMPLASLEAYERVKAEPFVKRLIGRGHTAVWAGTVAIAKHAHPLPMKPVKDGYFVEGFVGGKVPALDGDGTPKIIIDKSPAHWCWIGGPGSGKNICLGYLAAYRGCLFHVSNKPDTCDLIFGARIDQKRLERIDRGFLQEKKYLDTRGITSTTNWLAEGRGAVLDFAKQSVYGGKSKHTLLSDIDIDSSDARILVLAVASGFFPDDPNGRTDNRWFILAPKNFLGAAILHFLSWHQDTRMHNVPYVVERCMGFDQLTGEAGPKVFEALIHEMLKNNHPNVGAFIRTTAVQILELGSRSYGTLKSEFHNSCAAVYDSQFREQLTGRSTFSYYDIGYDGRPFTLMHVLPRGDAGLQAALPIFRAHVNLAMQIQQTKLDRPAIPTAFVVDEARQFLKGIECVTKAPMLLRDARVRMHQIYQSWTGVIETLGERGALEMEACSVMSYFGLDGDYETARRVSERLGKEMYYRKAGFGGGKGHREDVELMSPDRIMRELSIRSPMAYMMGPGMEPMRVERLAFKALTTREGCRFEGLPLNGQFDEGLSRYRYGDGVA